MASDKVAGTVTVNLYDVPFEQALEAVLSVNNFVSVRSGEFIYVYTRQEMQEAAKAAASARPACSCCSTWPPRTPRSSSSRS